jgi:hypothetical protein
MSGRNCFGQPVPGPGQLTVNEVRDRSTRSPLVDYIVYKPTDREWIALRPWVITYDSHGSGLVADYQLVAWTPTPAPQGVFTSPYVGGENANPLPGQPGFPWQETGWVGSPMPEVQPRLQGEP